jgi:hypothetical protein
LERLENAAHPERTVHMQAPIRSDTLMGHGASAATLAPMQRALARQWTDAKANDMQGETRDGTVRLASGPSA